MSIPADLSKYAHTTDLVPNHSHGFSVTLSAHTHSLEPQHLFLVEFLFQDEEEDDYVEMITLGVFTNEEIARSVAFDFSEKNIEDETLSALFITKFTVNEVQTEEIIVAYNFKEEEQF